MIRITNLSKAYKSTKKADDLQVFRDFSIDLPKGKVTTILGGNGCGKTTLLLILAGLIEADSGVLSLDGEPMSSVSKSFVFQDYKRALFPWFSVIENIAMPLIESGIPKRDAYNRVHHFIQKYDLSIIQPYLHSYPYQLSGGLAQNVSIARALIAKPRLLLLDEPFAALDLEQRIQMENRFLQILTEEQMTSLFISHDIDEAVFLGHSCLILPKKTVSDGVLISSRLPEDRTQDLKFSQPYVSMKREISHCFMTYLNGAVFNPAMTIH